MSVGASVEFPDYNFLIFRICVSDDMPKGQDGVDTFVVVLHVYNFPKTKIQGH